MSSIETKNLVKINMLGYTNVNKVLNVSYLDTKCCTVEDTNKTHILVKCECFYRNTLWVINRIFL